MPTTTILDLLQQAIVDKPTDGSDCTTLKAAQKELGRLRRITGKVVNVLENAITQQQEKQRKNSFASIASAASAQFSRNSETPHSMQLAARSVLRKSKSKRKGHRQQLTIDHSHKDYVKATVDKSSEDRVLIKTAIKGNPLFKDFLDSELEDFIDVFVPRSFSAGTNVIKQGDHGDTFYVVQSGSLGIFINVGEDGKQGESQVGVPYHRGGAFGELALIYDNCRAATIRAFGDVVLWEISRTAFKGLQLQIEQRAHETKITQLKNVKIGERLLSEVMDLPQIEGMAMATLVQSFWAGTTIIKEGEKGNTFYIITKGEVDVFNKSSGDKKLATLGPSCFFGEKALLGADTRQATCCAATNVECLTLTRDDFDIMLGNLNDIIKGKRGSLGMGSSEIMTNISPESLLEDFVEIKSLNELKIKRVLGEGAFGKVNLVKSKENDRLFALKAQGKANVIATLSGDKLINEYHIMKDLSHPCIVRCYSAFQDKKYVFFLLELLPGGEVMELLDEREKFSEDWTRFYCGSVILAFQYLHAQKIAYRDLKPENLVLDQEGYCRVVDFGLAKKCLRGKTWTMCGTPDYLAPEVVKGKGHDWAVDYWALGVLLYELCFGFPPFYDDDPSNTAKKVMRQSYTTPPHFSWELNDLISRLLTDQSKRLGRTKGGAKKIKKHEWYRDFDFQALMDRKMPVPWKPDIANIEKLGKKDSPGSWEAAPDTDWVANLGPARNTPTSTTVPSSPGGSPKRSKKISFIKPKKKEKNKAK